MKSFEDMEWHDARVLEIRIDRHDPGKRDAIFIDILWPDGCASTLTFSGCYKMNAAMNFGIIAEDSILFAEIIKESREIRELKETWGRMGVSIEGIMCFRISTNSTNSIIEMYCMDWDCN